jgi:hypothetical protein
MIMVSKHSLVVFAVLAALSNMTCNDLGESMIFPVDHGNFVLYVSNQRFDVDPVDIKVYIDGNVAVNQDFLNKGGHNWIRFEFRLGDGPHTLRAVSKRGQADLAGSFLLPDTPYAVVDFWGHDGLPGFTMDFSSQQPLFAYHNPIMAPSETRG